MMKPFFRSRSRRHNGRSTAPPLVGAPIRLNVACSASELHLIPFGKGLKFCRLVGQEIQPLADISSLDSGGWMLAMPRVGEVPGRPGTFVAIPACTHCEEGWIARLTADLEGVCIMRLDQSERLVRPILLVRLPDDCSAHSVALIGATLYIGGTPTNDSAAPSLWVVRLHDVTHGLGLRVLLARLQRPVFASSDVRPNELRLDHRHRVTLQMPTPFHAEDRKCFDDLIVDHQRQRLIAVDDVVFPKYLIEFRIEKDQQLSQLRTVAIDGHGAGECIVKGGIDGRFVVLLSCFGGWAVSDRRCLSFFDAESLEEVATIYLRADACHDMAIAHGRVYLAGGRHGLGVIDLHGSRNVIEKSPHAAVLSSDDSMARSSLALELAGALQYRTFAGNVGGDLKFVACLHGQEAVLAIWEQAGQSHPRILNCAGDGPDDRM